MSESKLPWWKSERNLSRKRKAAADLEKRLAQVGDSFLIVTEGEVSEPVYFQLLRESLQLHTVSVKVMPGKASDPRHVIQTASDEVKDLARRVRKNQIANNEVKKFDHVWAVIDTDVAIRQGFWNDVFQKSRDLKIRLAHSTPCFEYWLLLHLKMTTRSDLVDGTAAKKVFGDELGSAYSTSRNLTEAALNSIITKWPSAVRNARQVRQHHKDANSPLPANPSTEVDLLCCALNDAALEHSRKSF